MPKTCQSSNAPSVCDVEIHSGACIGLIHIDALHVFHHEAQEIRRSLDTHVVKGMMIDIIIIFIVIIQNISDHVSNVALSSHLVGCRK